METYDLIAYPSDDGQPTIHRAGCAHRTLSKADAIEFSAESRQAAAERAYLDCIREGSMTPADALADVHFAPCVRGLA